MICCNLAVVTVMWPECVLNESTNSQVLVLLSCDCCFQPSVSWLSLCTMEPPQPPRRGRALRPNRTRARKKFTHVKKHVKPKAVEAVSHVRIVLSSLVVFCSQGVCLLQLFNFQTVNQNTEVLGGSSVSLPSDVTSEVRRLCIFFLFSESVCNILFVFVSVLLIEVSYFCSSMNLGFLLMLNPALLIHL